MNELKIDDHDNQSILIILLDFNTPRHTMTKY